jgi:hypothetical protein
MQLSFRMWHGVLYTMSYDDIIITTGLLDGSFDNNTHYFGDKSDIELALIVDRLRRHQRGIDFDNDFAERAAEDVEWLLRHLVDVEDSLDSLENQAKLDALNALKSASKVSDDIALNLEEATTQLSLCRDLIHSFKNDPALEMQKLRQERDRLRKENVALKDKLASLPQTWQERLLHGAL